MSRPPRLPRRFYACPTLEVARGLLGATLVHEVGPGDRRVGRIVEVEAYMGPSDRASHARFGATGRARVMFGPPGHAYVYLIYGMYHCLNLVTEPEGFAHAVLIRAVEPLAGIAGRTQGPGLVCKAMAIYLHLNAADLCTRSSALYVEPRCGPRPSVGTSARVGVDYAGEWARKPWRFLLAGNPFVSRRPGVPR
ncbi:MAG: DNA-3-methyladenine glycosylase [Deltaproteobacteria bacterium]|nr:DNA-3-methyladenine glycosylase [Deltaproteobacteria bacterium]